MAALLALLLMVGCAQTSGYKQPVAAFQTSLDTSGAVLAGYYKDMNQLERDCYLQERLYDPKLPVRHEKMSSLEGEAFSALAIQARLDALNLLGKYGTRLGELAGSDAPARFESAASALGGNLYGLQDNFNALSKQGDTKANDYLTPIGKLVGILGRMYLEQQRDQALTAAIQEGAPTVESILDLLKRDMEEVVGPQRLTALGQAYTEQVIFYDKNRLTLTFAEREKVLANLDEAAQKYQAAKAYRPAEVVESIREAHQALVKYASSDRQPGSLAELATAMDVFSSRIKQISDAYKLLRNS
ncbi:MAG: hypothetical protein HY794_16315 [Desulfarculus sp.]|nr:hypothetical protein [Desulfarculus sp.]